MQCKKCNTEMELSDNVLLSNPPIYTYSCPICGHEETSRSIIPEKKEYVAQFTTSIQIGQYEWTVQTPSMKITPDTKVSEIIEFFKNNEPSKRALVDLRINELQ